MFALSGTPFWRAGVARWPKGPRSGGRGGKVANMPSVWGRTPAPRALDDIVPQALAFNPASWPPGPRIGYHAGQVRLKIRPSGNSSPKRVGALQRTESPQLSSNQALISKKIRPLADGTNRNESIPRLVPFRWSPAFRRLHCENHLETVKAGLQRESVAVWRSHSFP